MRIYIPDDYQQLVPTLDCFARLQGHDVKVLQGPTLAADALTAEIARSTTMNGRITAEWDGLVVCGAITPVITACWQHAVERKGFASVGGWMRAQPDETTRP